MRTKKSFKLNFNVCDQFVMLHNIIWLVHTYINITECQIYFTNFKVGKKIVVGEGCLLVPTVLSPAA